jgi:hypothetical protein
MAAATKKKRKEEASLWKAGASSGHIKNLKQSILETFDIYAINSLPWYHENDVENIFLIVSVRLRLESNPLSLGWTGSALMTVLPLLASTVELN